MSGFTMFVQFGFLSVTSRRRMEPSVSKVLKILSTRDSRVIVLSVKKINADQQSNVRIRNVTNIIILNVPEERRFIWNNSTLKS